MSSHVETEIASQPQCWRRAAALVADGLPGLPAPGERVAVVGCGTSWFIAMAYAALREAAGLGETDAFAASEMPRGRRYDRLLAITRSGTTTEVVDLLGDYPGVLATVITTDASTPAARAGADVIEIAFADEESVVQTRFATSALALLRASLGESIEAAATDAEAALAVDLGPYLDAEQITFVGRGWTIGLAHEAALKTREAAQFWAEAYPAMDYRHGPISIAQPRRLVWSIGEAPDGLADDVAPTGAQWVRHELDPLAQLVVAQRVAVGIALGRGLDPDRPRHLSRSVMLTP